MQTLIVKTALLELDDINKKLEEIRVEREEYPNETILPEYEINGVMVPIFLLKECAEGNIEEDLLINAIETGDFSDFSDCMCIHLTRR